MTQHPGPAQQAPTTLGAGDAPETYGSGILAFNGKPNREMPDGVPMDPGVLAAAAAAGEQLPSRCLLLENLIPIQAMQDPQERADLAEDVKAECEKCGPVAGVVVPPPNALALSRQESSRVYVLFSTVAASAAAQRTMHGRSFDGNRVEAAYVPEEDFAKARLPLAAAQPGGSAGPLAAAQPGGSAGPLSLRSCVSVALFLVPTRPPAGRGIVPLGGLEGSDSMVLPLLGRRRPGFGCSATRTWRRACSRCAASRTRRARRT
jgi:hypothetical protein